MSNSLDWIHASSKREDTITMVRIFILIITLFFSNPLWATGGDTDEPLPQGVVAGIDYLIDFVKPASTNKIDVSRLDGLIDFIQASKPPGTEVQLPERMKAASAYYEFEIRRNLKDILQLAYHPDIPLQMVSPGSVRMSYWVDANGDYEPLPSMWKQLDTLVKPIVVKGIENEEITPDATTGAYYRSLLDRALILYSKNGHKILISLARQKKVSDVGKKGLILGTDDQWNYFFSGEKGLTKAGMGWVDSHIYDTFSLMVYYESGDNEILTKCSVFKWLRAGWLGMNMVKTKHIQSGFKRFARDVKRVMESPHLPDPTKLADISTKIKGWPHKKLKTKMTQYLKHLENRLRINKKSSHEWLTQAANGNEYVSRMTPPEMHAALFLETLKYRLGFLNRDDVAYLGLPGL